MTVPKPPTLALTMIVKNEREQLPAFLDHHQALVDEILIVDTGSEDGTIEIARKAGATVIEHPWQESFALARNAGLEAVQADWIIFLDADERISRDDFAAIRALLTQPKDRVFLQETWNYCPDNQHLEWQPLRGRYALEEAGQAGLFVARRIGLFPNSGLLRFSGRVHESVLPAAQAAGFSVETIDYPVHHYGYARTEAVNQARQARYRRLVEMKLADNPGDPATQLEWASLLLESGEVEPGVAMLKRVVAGPSGLRPVVRALVLLGRLRREMGQLSEARKLLIEAVEQDPEFVFAWLERLRLEAAAEAWITAESVLSAAESRFGPHQPQLLREALRIRIQTRQLPAALETAEQLVRYCPQWQEIRDLADKLHKMVHASGGQRP